MPPEKTPIPLIHMDTKALFESMKDLRDGDIISYARLNNVIRSDVQGEAYPRLHSARNILRREKGLVFEPILLDPDNPNPAERRGLKCLTDSEKAKLASGAIRYIHRKTNKTVAKMATTNRDQLTKDEVLTYDTGILALSAIRHLSTAKSQEKVKALVDKNGSAMGYARLLEELAQKNSR